MQWRLSLAEAGQPLWSVGRQQADVRSGRKEDCGCVHEFWPTCADEYWPTLRGLMCYAGPDRA